MDKKSKEIFYGVVIVATLIVAIIGTSLAYFTYFTSSDDDSIKAHAATLVDIEYSDGNQVTAQADKLIPSSLDVVKKVYEKNIATIGLDAPTTNACIDSNGKQVCSVYRFSIHSDVDCEAYALLNNEKNEFTYLAYAVKDVTNNTWLTMNPNNSADEQFIKMTKCNNEDNKTNNDCYRATNGQKLYNTSPQANNSIFGYNASGKMQKLHTTTTDHVYDLVLFIYENNKQQNVDQKKNYLGTINVEVTNDIDAFIAGKK